MKNRLSWSIVPVLLGLVLIPARLSGQGQPAAGNCPLESKQFHACAQEKARSFNPPRTADGKPNLQGYWTARHNGAVWDIEPRPGQGSLVPATTGVIVDTADKKVPYQPWALAKRNELRTKPFEDAKAHCAPTGTPRATFTNYGLKIIQPADHVVILYEQMHDSLIVSTQGRPRRPETIKLWHPDPSGHWEGDTLVVEYRNLNGRQWFDMNGNFQSENTRVEERYTLIDPDTIHFRARIEDSTLYTQPWTIAFALTRNKEEGYYQLEFACHEGERDLQHYTEELGKGQSDQFVEPRRNER